MHLPVVVWSDSSIKALGLKVTTSAIAAPHDTVSIVMVCGTEQGTLLLFRSTTSSTWELDCLMLRHTARIVGLAMAVNEWGEFVCVSVDVQGSVGIWLLRDGRCMDWKPHVVSELTPLLGLQVFSNQRYALAYGEQGRMVVVDTWTCETLACLGTGFEQIRRDVGVGECAYGKDKSHQIDAKVLVLGTEGLCKLYNWVQPISTSTTPLHEGGAGSGAASASSSVSYLWQEHSSWVISWAADTLDMSCIHTKINPQTTFVERTYFPIHVRLSPNASLVLLVWQSKFAVFHRTWLEPGHDTRHHAPTRTTFYFGGVHGDAVVEFVDGGFTDNHTILLSTTNNTLYSFPAVVRDNVTAQVGQVFVFQQVDDMEIPQSVAYPLARVDLPATPHVVIPTCQCPRPSLLAPTPGIVRTATTEHHDSIVSYVGPCGCSLIWRPRTSPPPETLLALPLSPCVHDNDEEDGNITTSHAVLDHATSSDSPFSAPMLVHGYANGKLKLQALGGTASTAAESPPPPMTLSLPNGVPSCRIVALAHLSVTRVFKPSAAVYESYADSPTGGGGGPLGLGFQAAKLTKISTLLHKLQQHSLTPRPSLPSHSTATNHVSATTIPATTRSTTAPSSTSPSSIPVHSPSSPLRDHPVQSRVCLIFAGTSTGHVVISQLIPNVSWTVLRTFHRHSQSITSIYVTPSSRGTMILASVGADRKMTLYAVHQHEHDSGDRGLEVDVLLECVGHADDIVNVEWAFETNHVFVECADRMMYIWSLTTGILERIVPHVMVHQTTHHKHMWDLLRPLSSPPRGSASILPNVHVFPCDVDVPAGPSTRPSSPFNDHVTALLAYLLTWHDDAHIDQLVRDMLGVREPYLTYSIAISGPQGSISVPLPRPKCLHTSKWQHSAHLTAQLALALVTMCTSVMEMTTSQEDQVLWSQLITQIAVVLPERVPQYKEPSLEALAEFGFQQQEASQMASRLLLHGVIKRLPENLRSTKAAAYMTKFQVELQQLDKRPGGWVTWPMEDVVTRLGSYLVVLSILGTCFPGEISPSCARQVCEVLVACLQGPSHVAIVAAELLAKGLLLFRPHLTDVGQLVLQLIPLTLDDDAAKKRLKQASMRLLVEVGTCEASFVLTVLQQEMNVSDRSIAYREGVLAYLMTWVNLQFRQMVRHLPAVVDTVLSCLDPTKPDRRKKCLVMSTKCLHDLVKRFPMVDFHKATQRLAVGTMDGVILLYDLRMATKWRVLEGHTSSIGAVSFRKDGGMLSTIHGGRICL
ncbi:hypothetical protein, variant [Aphanomyces invadans]|uniref:Uncharacterized protein n=1 Tax=Aphanomyces invadans TaxID=157072 RepID=A0A024TL55_9STRA|nr:hypothetical protein, variant [Aphanomyces invadans]ETV94077.1 hypothetical protein, variant [Aphanomyces invadans]|eukprot:XP_008877279.1 hypothetical protein, variant [Aphanomyces invadans]